MLILFLNFLTTYSQDEVDVEFQNYISNFESFNYDSLLVKKFDNLLKLEGMSIRRPRNWGKREIDFNFRHSKFEYYFSYAEKNEIKWRKYILHLFENSTNTIGIICIDVFSTKPDSIKSYFIETELDKYIAKHDSLYCTKTTKSDFIMEFSKEKLYNEYSNNSSVVNFIGPDEIVGGGIGEYPSLVVKHRQWLRSYNLEHQAHAVDALELIYKTPYYIGFDRERAKKEKENDLNIIKYIKERNAKVWKWNYSYSTIELLRVF